MSQAPPPGAQFSWHQLQHGFDASPSSSPSRVVQHQVAHRQHHHGGAAGGGGAAPPRQHVAHPRAAPPPPAAAAAAGHVRAGSASSPHSYGSGGSSSAHLSSTPPHAHGFMYYSANGGAPTSPAAPQHPRQPPPQQQQHQQQHQQQTQEAAAGASLSSSAPDAYESGSSRLLQWSGNDDGGDGDGLDDEVAQGLLGSSIFALLNEPSVQGQSPAQFAGAMAAAQEQQYSHQHQAQPYGAFQPAPGQFAAAPQYDASFPFAHNQQGAEPQANYSSGPVGVAAHQSSAPAAAISRKGSSGGLSAESAEFTPSIAAAEINAMGTEALLAVASDMPEAIITGIKPKRDGNAIWVSFGRSPLYYAQIAVNMLKTHDDVHVHGLAKAVAIAIRVVVLLEEHKLGRIANISTGLTADTKKPRIHIVFAKDEGDAEPA